MSAATYAGHAPSQAVQRPSPIGQDVSLPPVDAKPCVPLAAVRFSDIGNDAGTGTMIKARSTPSSAPPPAPDLEVNGSESLFTLDSEEDDEDASHELFPLLKRQSLTEPPRGRPAAVTGPQSSHPPATSSRELTRALLSTRFHSRHLSAPQWESGLSDRDGPIEQSSSGSHTPSGVLGSSPFLHTVDSVDVDFPLPSVSHQASADFADYIQQHLAEQRGRQSTAIFFRHAKQSSSAGSGSTRTSTSVQWAAFEYREEDPPSPDNPFTRWSTQVTAPCSSALSRVSSLSRHNLSSDAEGSSECCFPTSDHPLARAGLADVHCATLPTPRRPNPARAGSSIVVPSFPHSYDVGVSPRASCDLFAAVPPSQAVDASSSPPLMPDVLSVSPVSNRPDSQRLVGPRSPPTLSTLDDWHCSPPITAHEIAVATPSRGANKQWPSKDAFVSDGSLPSTSSVVSPNGLTALEMHFAHPVSPSGRRSTTRYSRTFSQVHQAPHEAVCNESLSVAPTPSNHHSSKLFLSAPTAPLTYPSTVSRRPILSAKLAHKSQLARRALEDNALFFEQRRNRCVSRGAGENRVPPVTE